MKPLNLNDTERLQFEMGEIMKFIAFRGLKPVIVVVQLPDGNTVDSNNPNICGKCITNRLERILAVYKELYPSHVHPEENKAVLN